MKRFAPPLPEASDKLRHLFRPVHRVNESEPRLSGHKAQRGTTLLAEPALWALFSLAVAILSFNLLGISVPRLGNDSFQYLSTAREARESLRFSTSLIYYKAELSHGTIPAPLTWYPPGYPGLIALFSATGLSFVDAALVLSLGAFMLVAAGLWQLTHTLTIDVWAARTAAFCWIVNSHALEFAGAALSELPFTLVGLAAMLFLVRARAYDGKDTVIWWFGAGVMAGISYWIRYAGLFWIVTVPLLFLWEFIRIGRKNIPIRVAAAVCLLPGLVAMPVMLRNVAHVGDWRGHTAEFGRFLAVPSYVVETAAGIYHLMLGNAPLSQLTFPLILIFTGLGALLVISRVAGTPAVTKVACGSFRNSLWPTLMIGVIVYFLGVGAAAASTPISYGTRLFFPVLPHMIALLVAGAATLIRQRRFRHRPWVILCLTGYAAAHVVSLNWLTPDQYMLTQRALLKRVSPDGASNRHALEQYLRPGDIITATNGQAAGHILNHPTLALGTYPFVPVDWSEPLLLSQMSRFRSVYLIVFRDPRLDSGISRSKFLRLLSEGRHPSSLQLLLLSSEIALYKLRPVPLHQ